MEYNTDRGIAYVRIFLVDDETAILKMKTIEEYA